MRIGISNRKTSKGIVLKYDINFFGNFPLNSDFLLYNNTVQQISKDNKYSFKFELNIKKCLWSSANFYERMLTFVNHSKLLWSSVNIFVSLWTFVNHERSFNRMNVLKFWTSWTFKCLFFLHIPFGSSINWPKKWFFVYLNIRFKI